LPNELVKYEPELNTIPLRKFTPIEMNLFFSIVSRMRDKENQVVRFSFEQLKELSAYKQTAGKAFVSDLERTYDHLMDLKFGRRSKSGLSIERFVMFTDFEINGDVEHPYVDIRIHSKALPLLNNLESWVRYSLAEFRTLSSSYAKTAYRLMKQYRTQGWAEFSKEDFFELLDIPHSYQKNLGEVDRRVLKPIKEELTPLFRGLSIRKKYGKGRGNPVVGYKFTWKPEANDEDHFSKGYEADIRKKLYNIKHNNSLSNEEKWRAMDRVLNLPLGSNEAKEKNLKTDPKETSLKGLNKSDLLNSLNEAFN
jgi:plasmid replication initiation protein